MSPGLIPGGPGDGINKHNSKKMKIREKKGTENEKSNLKRSKACFIFSFTILSAACILTSVFISHLFNGELVRGIR